MAHPPVLIMKVNDIPPFFGKVVPPPEVTYLGSATYDPDPNEAIFPIESYWCLFYRFGSTGLRVDSICWDSGTDVNAQELARHQQEYPHWRTWMAEVVLDHYTTCQRAGETTLLPTNREVFLHGEVLEDWPCDVNPETGERESNAGIECLMRYKDHTYCIITDWAEERILFPDAEAIPTD
jgi:hypothetical protein